MTTASLNAPSLAIQPPTDPLSSTSPPESTDGSTDANAPPSAAAVAQQEYNVQPRSEQSRSSLSMQLAHLSGDSRRDSGMAPSTSAMDEGSETSEPKPSSPSKMPTTPSRGSASIPSIVLNGAPRTNPLKRPKSRGDVGRQSKDGNTSLPVVDGPFNGLATTIPSGEFADPFSSKEMQFSKRGSMVLSRSIPVTEFGSESQTNLKTIAMKVEGEQAQCRPASAHETGASKRPGVLTRSMSTENRRLSQRVRSWYEADTEELAHRSGTLDSIVSGPASPGGEERDTVPDLPDMLASRNNGPEDRLKERRSIGALSNQSQEQRDRYEAAGGIEDWTDLDSRDVDRYGFYNSRALLSKRSSTVSSLAPGGLDPPRPSSALSGEIRPQSQQAGRNPRLASSARLSVSADGRRGRETPSIRTARTGRSRASSMRPMSRQRRLFQEAGSMLAPMYSSADSDELSPKDLAHTSPSDRNLERKRALKWARMGAPVATTSSRKGGGTDFHFPMSQSKLVSRTWKGIPDCWRGAAWYSFLSSSAKRRSTKAAPQPTDDELESFFAGCQEQDCDDDMQIDMDVPRTVGGHIVFRQRYKGGQRFLFRVLRALSLYFPETGYVQGMAAVVATLLNYYTEERAFVMAVRLWTLRGIGYLYSEGFEGLMASLGDLQDGWMQETDIVKQLQKLGIDVSAWGPKWYLTLYNYVLPFPAMLRVWDVFILLGDPPSTGPRAPPRPEAPSADEKKKPALGPRPNLDVLHAVGTAMLTALHDTIIGADFENAMGVLTAPVPVGAGREDVLMRVAQKAYKSRTGKGR